MQAVRYLQCQIGQMHRRNEDPYNRCSLRAAQARDTGKEVQAATHFQQQPVGGFQTHARREALRQFCQQLKLPGIGDLRTLELVSRLGGEGDVPVRSVSRPSSALSAAPT